MLAFFHGDLDDFDFGMSGSYIQKRWSRCLIGTPPSSPVLREVWRLEVAEVGRVGSEVPGKK